MEWRDVFGYAKSTASTAEHLTISHALASLADAADDGKRLDALDVLYRVENAYIKGGSLREGGAKYSVGLETGG